MPTFVSAADAKAGFADLLRRAEAGDEIVVTRNGEPIARLVPSQTRAGGFLRDEVLVNDANWWHSADAPTR
jgi:prevent-host-death family protein